MYGGTKTLIESGRHLGIQWHFSFHRTCRNVWEKCITVLVTDRDTAHARTSFRRANGSSRRTTGPPALIQGLWRRYSSFRTIDPFVATADGQRRSANGYSRSWPVWEIHANTVIYCTAENEYVPRAGMPTVADGNLQVNGKNLSGNRQRVAYQVPCVFSSRLDARENKIRIGSFA